MKCTTALSTLVLLCIFHFNGRAQFHQTAAPEVKLTTTTDLVSLEWRMPKEVNTSYFIVEESTDGGKSFRGIRIVKAAGSTQLPTQYQIAELGFIKAQAVYRIVLVYMDGIRVSSNSVQLQSRRSIRPQQVLTKK